MFFKREVEASDSDGKLIARLVAFILMPQHETLNFSPALCRQLMKGQVLPPPLLEKKATTAATNGKVTHLLYNQQTKAIRPKLNQS